MAKDKSGGLEGVSAGRTAIATVGKEGKGLTYRGYSIYDLAEHSTFEEVAYLLIYGRLPNQSELSNYKKTLSGLRGLPAQLKTVLEQIPGSTHPMDVMRTGCSMLGTLEPEGAGRDQIAVANRLTGCFSSILLYWHHFTTNGKRIETETDDDSSAGHSDDVAEVAGGDGAWMPGDTSHYPSPIYYALLTEGGRRGCISLEVKELYPTRLLFGCNRRHRRAARPSARRRQ